MSEDINAKITKVIVEKLGVSEDQVKPEAAFIDDLGADSAGSGRIGDGAGRRVRHRNPGRRSRETEESQRRHRLRKLQGLIPLSHQMKTLVSGYGLCR